MPYVNLNYKPKASDIVCEFYMEPARDITIWFAAENVAAESSVGTWTDVKTSKPYVARLGAKVYKIKRHGKGAYIKVAYPVDLFEYDNVPEIMSSIAGNIFGMKVVKNLRLEDVHLSKEIIKSFKGPKFGIKGIRKLLRVKKRPLVGTIVKPKLGLHTADHAKVAYDAWVGGCDIVKDDENLSAQKFNPFRQRLIQTLKMRNKAEKETGEKKVYMINVTAETKEMIKRAKMAKEHGSEYIMVDIITCGFSALQTLRNEDLGLVLHGHRAMHAAMTRNKKHGISMLTISKLIRLIGLDQLHTGTIVGKLEGGKEIIDIDQELREKKIKEHHNILQQDWFHLKPVFPVSSGGLHPGHVPKLVQYFGKDLIMQFGGGVHGHPDGTTAGTRAVRQAVEAVMKNTSLERYAKNHKELAEALKKWGHKKPI